MENPFQYLVDEHQLQLKRAHLKHNESQLERSRLHVSYQDKLLEKRGFEDLVLDVLGQLQQVVYPGLSVRSDDQGWTIGRWSKRTDASFHWNSVLVVRLVNDELSGNALCFESLRYQHKARAELSRESLSEALQRLYPVRKEKGTSSDRSAGSPPYDAMVAQAFADLQKKVNLELHLMSGDKKWVIGFWKIQNEALEWWEILEIRLVYNWKNQIRAFECLAKGQSARVELDPNRLSEALLCLSGYGETENSL